LHLHSIEGEPGEHLHGEDGLAVVKKRVAGGKAYIYTYHRRLLIQA
jgi:hypothetical protein